MRLTHCGRLVIHELMAIQFACPSCRQPIEVDHEWGGQHVSCPFCERVVTAPTMSTLSDKELVDAGPARELSPVAAKVQQYAPAKSAEGVRAGGVPIRHLAGIGLGLSLLSILVFIIVNIVMTSILDDERDPEMTPRQAQEKLVEVLMAPDAGTTRLLIICGSCVSFCSWIAGLCFSIFALVSRTASRRGIAKAAIICSGVLPFLMILGLLASL